MRRLHCQDHPDELQLEAAVLEVRPGALAVARSPFFPGGGGQMADRGTAAWSGGEAKVVAIEADGDLIWHHLEGNAEAAGRVLLSVDPVFRALMSELHTVAHIANAVAFQAFDGALLTGAQLSDQGTLRIDLDLPDTDNDRVRALAEPMNDVIARDLAVRSFYLPQEAAEAETGLFRSKGVSPPPQDDGLVRIVEITELDRQACGGTHLRTTGQARRISILKVENKGRHNRRVRIGLGEG